MGLHAGKHGVDEDHMMEAMKVEHAIIEAESLHQQCSSHHTVWCTVQSSWPCATGFPNTIQEYWSQWRTITALL